MVVLIGFSLDDSSKEPISADHPYWDRELVAVLTASIEESRREIRSNSNRGYHLSSRLRPESCELGGGCKQFRHYCTPEDALLDLIAMEEGRERFERFSPAGLKGSRALRMMDTLFLHRRPNQTVPQLIHPDDRPNYEKFILELARRGAVDCEFTTTETLDGTVKDAGERTLSWITVQTAPGGSSMAEYISDSLVLTDYGSMLMDLLHFDSYLSHYLLRIPELAQKNNHVRRRIEAIHEAIDSSRVVPLHPKLPQALRSLDSYPRIKGYLDISHLKRMVKCSAREARLIRRDLDRLGLLDSHVFYNNGRTSEESSLSYEAIRELGGGEAIAQMIEWRKLPDGSSVSASFGHR